MDVRDSETFSIVQCPAANSRPPKKMGDLLLLRLSAMAEWARFPGIHIRLGRSGH
jgi:hypothetical protein